MYAAEPTLGTPTLIADYTLDSEFLTSDFGKMVIRDYTKSDDCYTVSYPSEGGVRITKNSKAGASKDSVPRIGIDFDKIIDANENIYQKGLSGVYAIDITLSGELTKADGTSGRTDTFFSDFPGDTALETPCSMRISPGFKIEGYEGIKGGTKRFAFSKGVVAEPNTYRFVFDTINHKMYGYENKNGAFSYVGEMAYNLESVASFMYSPRDMYLKEGSYFEISNVKVYEYENSASAFLDTFKENMPDSFNYVSGGVVDTTSVVENIAFPESWSAYTLKSSDETVLKADGTVKGADEDKEVTLTVTDNSAGVYFEKEYQFMVKAGVNQGGGTEEPPVEPEEPSDPLLGGTLLFDYDLNKEFANSEIGKKVIVDQYDTVPYDYEVVYGNDGIKIEYTSEPVFTNEALTSGKDVDAFGINLTALMEDNTEKGNRLYKTGFSGLYAVEFTIKIDQGKGWLAGTNKASGRADLYIGDKASTFSDANFINLRYTYKSPSLTAYMGSSKSFNMSGFKYGNDMTIRIVLDSENGKFYGYTKNADGTYNFNGEGVCPTTALTYLWYKARTFNENGDAITFKNIKLYEIERDINASGEEYYETAKSTLPDTFGTVSGATDFKNVSENIVIPENVLALYTLASSNSSILDVDGVINTKLYENTPVILTASGVYGGVYFSKEYDFAVAERADISRKDIAKYNYSTDDVELIYSGDNKKNEEGFKIVNKTYSDGTTVGLLKSKKYTDSKSSTYVYDYSGSYDFDIKVAPQITKGSAYVEIGNYNVDTGKFESYGKIKLTEKGAYYCDVYDDIYLNEFEDEYALKFRVNTEENKIWVWANSEVTYYNGYFYEGSKPVNAYRVGFDEAEENDFIVLKSAEFKELIFDENIVVSDALNVANSITTATIVNNPDDAYGDINLPKINGYNIEWSTDNPLADLENKKIFRSAEDEDITITAFISSIQNPEVKVRKDFYLKVEAATNEGEILDGALAKITAASITNQKELVADLKLPKVTEEGFEVSWESLSMEYISKEGVINKSINITKPTEVTFKVTVSSNDASVSKNIKFTLSKRGADVVLVPSDITVPVEGVVTYKATVTGDNSGAVTDGNGSTLIAFDVKNGEASFDYNNSDFAKYKVNDEFELAFVMNFNDNRVSVLADGNVVVDYVPFLVSGNGFKNVVVNGTGITKEKVVFDEYSLFDYNRKVFDYMGVFGNIFVAENRSMNTASIGGVAVNWTSSNEEIITNNGIYTAPENITFCDVTLELSMNSGSGAKYTETINCVAVPAEVNNIASGASVISTVKEDVVNDKTKLTDGDFTTYLEANNVKGKDYIVLEFKENREVNGLYFFQGDDGIKSCDIYLSEDGINWGESVTSAVFDGINSNYVTFDYQNAKFVKIANITCDNNRFKLYEIKAYLGYTSNNKAQFDIFALDMPSDYNLKVTSINLPTVGSVYGSTLTWSSTKPDVISTKGTVTKTDVATEVILTVTAEFEGTTATKKFTYLVPASSSVGNGGAGGGGGSYAGNISGVNTGGAGLAATPTQPEIELEKEEIKIVENGMFTDTPKDAWYYGYLEDLVEKGVVNGYDDGSFGPNNNVTREEFLKMLISAIGAELTDKTTEYEDVKSGDWFAPYVYTAKKLGIASGISNAEFGVGMPISRQDMCVMIYNTTDKKAEFDDGIFADHSAIAKYAFNAVYAIKAMGIVNGYENGEFKPEGKLTRGEAVKVISLVIKMK